MKKMMKYIFVILCALCFLLPAEAADRSENREKGYFDNTRTVILLPVRFTNSSGNYAAAYLQKEMKQVFRYPYYREMEYADYSESNITPEELSDIQIETGADIVVMPVITEWSQWVSYPFAIFRDVDPIVETRVSVDIYSLKKGEKLRRDSASYFEREEEGLVRNEYIMDALMKRLWKKFPYRRVPTDISPNLSGEIKGENKTPTATMNK